ncbi:MAG: hypothetical protein WD009_04400, partial [Phycisphaeraceae bacterium]
QLGANVQWGADDHTLIFNDVDLATHRPHGVRLDWTTGEAHRLEGTVYHVSPDGLRAVSSSLDRARRTQSGYGVTLADEHTPRNIGAPDDDGLWLTDLTTGRRELILSLRDAVRFTPSIPEDDLDNWQVYGFHSKFNPQGDRLIFTVRAFPGEAPRPFDLIGAQGPRGGLEFNVLTLRPDGSEVRNAVPAEHWRNGGHHINWFPDGERLSMNLGIDGREKGMFFVACGVDGSDLKPIMRSVPGSGHPTIHRDGRHILTDAYAREPVAYGDGSVPLRLVDRQTGEDRHIVRIMIEPGELPQRAMRVDPHPAWDRDWRRVAFNGFADGTRRVYVADLGELVG